MQLDLAAEAATPTPALRWGPRVLKDCRLGRQSADECVVLCSPPDHRPSLVRIRPGSDIIKKIPDPGKTKKNPAVAGKKVRVRRLSPAVNWT